MLKKILTLMASSSLLLASASASAAVIDLFTDDQALLSATGTTVSSSALGGDIIGGERDIEVTAGTRVKAEAEVLLGELNIASNLVGYNPGSDAITTIQYEIVVQWDGLDGSSLLDEDGLAGIDLSGLSGFMVEVLSSDGVGSFTIDIADTNGNTYSNTYPYIPVDPLAPQSFIIYFSDFVGMDFSDVGSIQLTLNGEGETDIRVSSIEAVPEPSTLAVMGLSLVALAGVARRKKKANQ